MSGKFPETLAQLENDWTIDDMDAAHLALDLSEDTTILLDLRDGR